MNKSVFILCLLFGIVASCNDEARLKKTKPIPATTLNPFPSKAYSKVIAYKMRGMDNEVIENATLSINITGEQKELKEIEVAKLLSVFSNSKTYGGVSRACFEPRSGYVFYDRNKVIAHATICIACNSIRTSPYIGVFQLSDQGRSRFVQLEKQLFLVN